MNTRNAQRPETYQLGELLGLQAFNVLNHPDLRKVGWSDIDAWQQSFLGNRQLFADLKTANEDLSKMGGQLDGLMEISRLRGCQVLIIFDPWHGYPIRGDVDKNTKMRVELLRNGVFQNTYPTTLERLQQATFDWRNNKGALREPIINDRAVIGRLLAQDGKPSTDDFMRKLALPEMRPIDWKAREAERKLLVDDRVKQTAERDKIAKEEGYPERPAGWVKPPTARASEIIGRLMQSGGTEKDIAKALADARAEGTLLLT